MSLFPFIDGLVDTTVEEVGELPLFKEYAWDVVNDLMILRDGKPVVVEGNEALKIWCYKALRTARYRWLAYSWNYGNEIETLIGSDWTQEAANSELARFVREALLVNPYITGVTVISSSFNDGLYNMSLNIATIYGEATINV